MKSRLLMGMLGLFLSVSAFGADAPVAPRVSIFSTSTDWQAVTGRLLNEYRGKFTGRSPLIGRGLVLYYLDGFPCYGLGGSVRAWVAPDGKSNDELRLACIAAPKTINFAWLHASRDADDQTTTGIITCSIEDKGGRDFVIDLSKCERGPDWQDYK